MKDGGVEKRIGGAGPGIYQVVQCQGDSMVNPMGPPGEPRKFISECPPGHKKGTHLLTGSCTSTGQG